VAEYMLRYTPGIQVQVFRVVTPWIIVIGYHRFGVQCCLHLQGEVTGDRRPTHSTIEGQSVRLGVQTLLGLMTIR